MALLCPVLRSLMPTLPTPLLTGTGQVLGQVLFRGNWVVSGQQCCAWVTVTLNLHCPLAQFNPHDAEQQGPTALCQH